MPAAEADAGLSLDMNEMDFSAEVDEVSTEEAKVDFGDFNLDDSLDAPSATDDEFDLGEALDLSTDAGESSTDGEMIGIDEVATKLDLAKAYIDMGDPDGAKAILDEVMKEGNDSQQSEAQELVSQL